jgi:hypothetical protein
MLDHITPSIHYFCGHMEDIHGTQTLSEFQVVDTLLKPSIDKPITGSVKVYTNEQVKVLKLITGGEDEVSPLIRVETDYTPNHNIDKQVVVSISEYFVDLMKQNARLVLRGEVYGN